MMHVITTVQERAAWLNSRMATPLEDIVGAARLEGSLQLKRIQLQYGRSKCLGESNEKRLEGQVLNVTGDILDELDGYWNSHLVSKALGPLWINTNDRQEDYYYFSPFTLMLNALTPQLVKFVPPTDSRLRPDQRALEMGMSNVPNR